MKIKDLYKKYQTLIDKEVELQGWIKNHRKQAYFGFIDFYDGTCFKSIQLIYDDKLSTFDKITELHIGSSIKILGTVIKSEGSKQEFEIKVKDIILIGDCPEDYPIQPKRHSMEFLREKQHLRMRTSTFQAVFRIRSVAASAIHEYFQKRGFVYIHSPFITDSDGEGAGEMFQVTTLDLDKIAQLGEVDYSKDFFSKKVGLSVTGQLEEEPFIFAFKDTYTFGPSFRADKSHTKIHMAEFWHVEPEMAFCDLDRLIEVEEEFLKYIIKTVIKRCPDELEFLDKFVEKGLIKKLQDHLKSKSKKITHKEAIDILLKADKKWEITPDYKGDISKEHEKYLTEEYFKGPIFITDWPKDIKAFYMKQSDDGTVKGVDYILPRCGEIMGGSQREDDYDKLIALMKERDMDIEPLKWYTELRKYGTVPHSGFGMGFDRIIMYLTGMESIKDVIPYPRTHGSL